MKYKCGFCGALSEEEKLEPILFNPKKLTCPQCHAIVTIEDRIPDVKPQP
jgi:DNA-directed RNA polymerase subunit RPC12/RpoP